LLSLGSPLLFSLDHVAGRSVEAMPVTVVHSVLEPSPTPEGRIAGGMFGDLLSLLEARDMSVGTREVVPLLVLEHVEPVRLQLVMVLIRPTDTQEWALSA
jgi:hypothetical protein